MKEERQYSGVDEAFKGPVRRNSSLSPFPGSNSSIGLREILVHAMNIPYYDLIFLE